MSEGHTDHTDHDGKADKSITQLENSSILNCTKVVRLFVVNSEPGRTLESIIANESPTRTDVFVVSDEDSNESARDISRSAGGLKPKSIGKSAVVDHDKAHEEHHGSVVVLSADSDQIEWQCDVPFRVVNIEMSTHEDDHFPKEGDPPPYPFEKDLRDLKEMEGDRSTPIRSGAIVRSKDKKPWKQLYKAHLELKIGGRWKPLDPDVYCGSPSA